MSLASVAGTNKLAGAYALLGIFTTTLLITVIQNRPLEAKDLSSTILFGILLTPIFFYLDPLTELHRTTLTKRAEEYKGMKRVLHHKIAESVLLKGTREAFLGSIGFFVAMEVGACAFYVTAIIPPPYSSEQRLFLAFLAIYYIIFLGILAYFSYSMIQARRKKRKQPFPRERYNVGFFSFALAFPPFLVWLAQLALKRDNLDLGIGFHFSPAYWMLVVIFLGLLRMKIELNRSEFENRLHIAWRYYSALNDPRIGKGKFLVTELEEALRIEDWATAENALSQWDQNTFRKLKQWVQTDMQLILQMLEVPKGNREALPRGSKSWKYPHSKNWGFELANRSFDELEWWNEERANATRLSLGKDLEEFFVKHIKYIELLEHLRKSIFDAWDKIMGEIIPKLTNEEQRDEFTTKQPEMVGLLTRKTLPWVQGYNVSPLTKDEIADIRALAKSRPSKGTNESEKFLQTYQELGSEPESFISNFFPKKISKDLDSTWLDASEAAKEALNLFRKYDLKKRSKMVYNKLQEKFCQQTRRDDPFYEELNCPSLPGIAN